MDAWSDQDRLDWIARNRASIWPDRISGWACQLDDSDLIHRGGSPRDAIDAAIGYHVDARAVTRAPRWGPSGE